MTNPHDLILDQAQVFATALDFGERVSRKLHDYVTIDPLNQQYKLTLETQDISRYWDNRSCMQLKCFCSRRTRWYGVVKFLSRITVISSEIIHRIYSLLNFFLENVINDMLKRRKSLTFFSNSGNIFDVLSCYVCRTVG